MTLLAIATLIMDQYYQDYAPGDKFIDIEDFKQHVAIKYSEMLNLAYKQARAENKSNEGFSNIELAAAWLIEEEIEIKSDDKLNRFYATTSHPMFSFDFDGSANALQGVHSIGGKHRVYRKIMLNERGNRQIIPKTEKVLFYANSKTEIIFWDAIPGEKVLTQYIPAVAELQDDCLLSDNMSFEIEKEVLNLMISARSGTIIQKADDQNKNVTQANQTNQSLNKP